MKKLFYFLFISFFVLATSSVGAQQIITQNNSFSIAIGLGMTCNEGGLSNGNGKTKETHYYRYFDLPNAHGIANGFTVSSVQFGILWFVSGGTGYPITINIYSAEIGDFPNVNQTLQGTATYVSAGNEMFKLVELDLNAEIPAGEAMVMEMVLPEDGVTNIIPGFNQMGDSNPAYISAEFCDLPNPESFETVFADIDNFAIVFVVKGDSCDAVNPPYLENFETAIAPTIPICTAVENTGSGNEWEVFAGVNGEFDGQYLKYTAHETNDANAWFYTRGINLAEGETYEISYDYGSSTSSESLKIAYGLSKNHNEMLVLAEHDEINTSGSVLTNTIAFSPSNTGVYYFGFNAFSSANQGELYVDNISVELISEEDPNQCSVEYEGQINGGLGDLQQLILAADFTVEADTTMEINQFIVNIFGNITDATIYFYKNASGMPGELLQAYHSLPPASQTYIGTNFGYLIYENVFEFTEPIQLVGDGSDTTYWVGIETTAGSQGAQNFWEKENSFHGHLPFYSTDGGYSWSVDPNNMDLAFVINGICTDELGIGHLDLLDFAYYPNPVNDILKIDSQNPIKTVEVFNTLGQIVLKSNQMKDGQINLNQLDAGIYFFRVMLEGNYIETFKIIKK